MIKRVLVPKFTGTYEVTRLDYPRVAFYKDTVDETLGFRVLFLMR